MDLEHGTVYPLDQATLIKPDGTTSELKPANGKTFTYEEIKTAIGNYIQPIRLRDWTTDKEAKKMNFICDEEGAINGSAYNEKATKLLRSILGPFAQELYGNIIFLPNKLYRI